MIFDPFNDIDLYPHSAVACAEVLRREKGSYDRNVAGGIGGDAKGRGIIFWEGHARGGRGVREGFPGAKGLRKLGVGKGLSSLR